MNFLYKASRLSLKRFQRIVLNQNSTVRRTTSTIVINYRSYLTLLEQGNELFYRKITGNKPLNVNWQLFWGV